MPYGKPLFDYDDAVEFDVFLDDRSNEPDTLYGTIEIVDAYGTFGQQEEASYDIMVSDFPSTGEKCLFKHIVESRVRPSSQL